ncbi:MAG: hypothetical protein IPM53_30170 [Anaerolineaceae bacterium]|nr:hypothetical protein [Anaerolineaceae bacterium]
MHKLALRFGENVYAYGKHCGQLAKIVVTPKVWRITDVIVENGLLFKHATVLPISAVSDTLGQNINLNVPVEQMKNYPEFQEMLVKKGRTDWQASKAVGEVEYFTLPAAAVPVLATATEKERTGVSKEALILDSDTVVECLESQIGRLSHVIVDAKDYLVNDLVFAQGTLFPKNYTISSYYVDYLSEAKIQIALTRAEADQLPEYTFLHYS